MSLTTEDMHALFSFSEPRNPTEVMQYETIRRSAQVFAEVIRANTPEGRDRDTAILKVREAVLFANGAISLG